MINGNIGEDDALLANAADMALIRAQAGSGSVSLMNRAYTALGVSPGTLTSTTSAKIVAAAPFTPKTSGLFSVMFNVNYSLSAADTVGFTVIAFVPTPSVAVTGGVSGCAVGGLVYETSGHAISVTGSGGPSAGASDIVVPTPAIGLLSSNISGPLVLPMGVQSAIALSAQTIGGAIITFTSLTALIFELP
jgi:hypothetical protein